MPTGHGRNLPRRVGAAVVVLIMLSTFVPAVRAQSTRVSWSPDDDGNGNGGKGGPSGNSEYRIGVGRADCTGPPVEVTFVSIT